MILLNPAVPHFSRLPIFRVVPCDPWFPESGRADPGTHGARIVGLIAGWIELYLYPNAC